MKRILFSALAEPPTGGGGGGGAGAGAGGAGAPPAKFDFNSPFDVNTMAPEDLRKEASFSTVKTVGDLAKSFIHSQRMIGTDKIAKPQKDWTEAQWNDFYKNLGRPDAADGYTFKPDATKLPKGFNIDDGRLKDTKAALHKMGLTDKQASEVLGYYLERTTGEFTTKTQEAETNRTKALAELKTEYGDKFDANLDIARSVVVKFGDDALKTFLNETGLGDSPAMIRLFHKIGMEFLDDTARGEGAGLVVGGAADAIAEIAKLKGNQEFQKQLMNRGPGHQEAVDRWAALHKKAYPDKK